MKLKKTFFVVLLPFITLINVHAQKEAWNWNFGTNAGVDFSTGSPVAILTNSISTVEGVASISDSSGNLLFYTDGITVMDHNGIPMPNGTGLYGHASSTQSAIILKMPGSDSLYYLFTVDNKDNGAQHGLNYSIVDMSLTAGFGDVTQKNVSVRPLVKEKLTAARHANGTDYWIITNDWSSDDIYTYHLSASGLNTTPVVSSIGPFHSFGADNTLGYLRVNRQNSKVAIALWGFASIEVMDFDNSTGLCSNKQSIQGTGNDMQSIYGLEFSPNGNYLYATNLNYNGAGIPYNLLQFDLSAGTGTQIYNSRVNIFSQTFSLSTCIYYFGALQLGPDGKIYIAVECDTYLHSITNPDLQGVACNYVPQAVSLGGRVCRLGLPNFLSTYVLPTTGVTNQISAINDISISPNPSNGNFSVNLNALPGSNVTMTVCNILGKKLIEKQLNTGKNEVNLNYTAGVYVATLNAGSDTRTVKIVVN